MSLVIAAALAAAPVTVPACSWDRPGHNPFMGDVVAAVDRYQDIPAATRAKLKARMAAREYDEVVAIQRDAIVGKARYNPQIQGMHFGNGQVCGTVTRAKWSADMQERGLVYCEDGHCILVPTVCRNVSRIQREPTPVGPALAGLAPGAGGGAGGPGVPAGGVPGAAGPAAAPMATAQGLATGAAQPAAADSFAAGAGLGAGGVAIATAVSGSDAAAAGGPLLAAAGNAGGAGGAGADNPPSPGFNWGGGGAVPWLGGSPTTGPAGAVLLPDAGVGPGTDTGGGVSPAPPVPPVPPIDSGGPVVIGPGDGGFITDPGAVTPVPEPGSALLLALGLGGMGVWSAWRRRHRGQR